MLLIVESGSTKADWSVLEGVEEVVSFQTKGWNPLFLTEESMLLRLNSSQRLLSLKSEITKIHFYAPGLGHQESKNSLKHVLHNFFENAVISIESDLLAAARAAYIGEPIFVSILGTGSNTAFFDGEHLEQWTPSLGFILGDEGSGAALGKRLLKAYMYQSLPKDLYVRFTKEYAVSKERVLEHVYKQEQPSKYLASFVPFLVENKEHPYVKKLVEDEIQIYIDTHLKSNLLLRDYALSFVGSVAFCFQEIIKSILLKEQITHVKFIKAPIDILKAYHLSNK